MNAALPVFDLTFTNTRAVGASLVVVDKHPLSNAGDAGSIPGQELRSHVPGSN